jgi:hypothetical protein
MKHSNNVKTHSTTNHIPITPSHNNNNNNIDANYTRKGLQIQRQNIFNKQLVEKQKDFELYNTPPKKNIDFSDKSTDNMDNIDDLLEQEMAKRTREMNIIMDENKKINTTNVEKWIYNSSQDNSQDNINKIIIHDKIPKDTRNVPSNIITPNVLPVTPSPLKKVTFKDMPIKSGIREETTGFINRLKPILQKSSKKSIPSTIVNDATKPHTNAQLNTITQQEQHTEREYIYSQLDIIQNQLDHLTTQISTIQDYIIISSKQAPQQEPKQASNSSS